MAEVWHWITDLGNSKVVALVLFFGTFIGILVYVFASHKRSARLESYKFIPLQDEDDSDVKAKAEENDEQRERQ